ncbi:MAG: 16S rRNA (guanine(966)-N(2))-methyltransferase RsmD [Acidimicrobiia bacterium]
MRIIAGSAKGRTVVAPRGLATRPMTDRAREALFSSLADRVLHARVLDLFAGTGSLGLEALSRGAQSAVFVEKDGQALVALRRNVATINVGGEVVGGDVSRYLDHCSSIFDLVFVDPPYALSLASVEEVLRKLGPLLDVNASVVVHRRAGENPPGGIGDVHLVSERRYGDSRLWTYRKEET